MHNQSKEFGLQIKQVFPRPTKDISKKMSQIAEKQPDLWQNTLLLATRTREMLIKRITPHRVEETTKEIELLVELLNSECQNMAERLLVQNVVNSYLRLCQIEQLTLAATDGKTSKGHFTFWESALTGAQRRFIRALESLVKIKKLARSTPAFQINIAQAGGKQINVTGKPNPSCDE